MYQVHPGSHTLTKTAFGQGLSINWAAQNSGDQPGRAYLSLENLNMGKLIRPIGPLPWVTVPVGTQVTLTLTVGSLDLGDEVQNGINNMRLAMWTENEVQPVAIHDFSVLMPGGGGTGAIVDAVGSPSII